MKTYNFKPDAGNYVVAVHVTPDHPDAHRVATCVAARHGAIEERPALVPDKLIRGLP